jgi:hypothetical protein
MPEKDAIHASDAFQDLLNKIAGERTTTLIEWTPPNSKAEWGYLNEKFLLMTASLAQDIDEHPDMERDVYISKLKEWFLARLYVALAQAKTEHEESTLLSEEEKMKELQEVENIILEVQNDALSPLSCQKILGEQIEIQLHIKRLKDEKQYSSLLINEELNSLLSHVLEDFPKKSGNPIIGFLKEFRRGTKKGSPGRS